MTEPTIAPYGSWSSSLPIERLTQGVVFIGEDVAAAGGVFKTTEGLLERFGPDRVRDTPISEQAITGALMGGAPLAQGTVYLLLRRSTAHWLTAALVTTIVMASVAIWLSPIQFDLVESHRLSGKVFEWTWVRRFSPFINLYAVIFLIGGAIISAVRYSRVPATRHRMWANVWIAAGAILPGIGGTATRFGYTEVLYVTELIGLLMMWRGYVISVRA